MEPTEEEFLAHIRETIQEYSLPYSPGAWERFQERDRKNKLLWCPAIQRQIVAAALIIVSGFGYLYFKRDQWNNKQILPSLAVQRKSSKIVPSGAAHNETTEVISKHRTKAPVTLPKISDGVNGGENKISAENAATGMVENVLSSEISAAKISLTTVKSGGKTVELVEKHRYLQQIFLPELIKKELTSQNPWNSDIFLSGNLGKGTQQKPGLGVAVDYTLNNYVSLSTGISYLHITSLEERQNIPQYGKNLSSVETALTGIDIPVEVQYALGKHGFLSIGISRMSILTKIQQLNFTEDKVSSITVEGANGPVTETRLVTTHESVEVEQSSLPQQKYIGFYNFSFGFKQQIGKDTRVVIEPYLKLPIKKYSDQKSYLSSAGLRLRFSF